MPPDPALLSTLTGSNYLCLELIFMVPKVFEPLEFDCRTRPASGKNLRGTIHCKTGTAFGNNDNMSVNVLLFAI